MAAGSPGFIMEAQLTHRCRDCGKACQDVEERTACLGNRTLLASGLPFSLSPASHCSRTRSCAPVGLAVVAQRSASAAPSAPMTVIMQVSALAGVLCSCCAAYESAPEVHGGTAC